MLAPSKECLITKDDNFIKNIQKKKLSKIEFLILFSIFLNQHKVISRVNFIVDISLMEENKKIKVNRKNN
jgi:hypothetical protein